MYKSTKYSQHVNSSFQTAHANGFDPIKALTKNKSCEQINFHAWFPVFNDPNAVKVAGGAARAGQKPKKHGIPIVGGIVNWLGDQWDTITAGHKKCDTKSATFADPRVKAVTDYELELLDEIILQYPEITGVNLDYIRYAAESDIEEGCAVDVEQEAVTDFVRRVREKFPKDKIELSADVYSGDSVRRDLGQEGILLYLDIIMPMEYTEFAGFRGTDEVKKWTEDLKRKYPNKILIPILRGWICREDGGCSRTETPKETLQSLKDGIQAAKQSGSNGYGIFTYESLLLETGIKNLSVNLKDLGF